MYVVAAEAAVFERVFLVPSFAEAIAIEWIGIDNDGPARIEIGQIGLERGRVHRHQHLRRVTRGVEIVGGKIDLIAAQPGDGSGRSADFGGNVGKGTDVVAHHG